MYEITNGICKGLKYGCEVGSLSYPEDIDENDNIRPVELVNGLCVACIEVAQDLERHETISREDVADTIIECLRNYLTIGKTIRMVSGELKIKDAIAQFVGGGNLPPIA